MKTPISPSFVRGTLFVLLVLACILPAGGSPSARTWKSYVDPSLISEIVLRDGKLYIASTGGLLIYRPSDGTFEQHTNTIGLPSNFLTCLAFDREGRLWAGTETAGVARIDETPGGFEVTPLSSTFHGLSDDRITDLAVWGDTLVYTTKAGAGLIVQNTVGTRFFVRDGLPSDVVNAALPHGDRVWLATDRGVVYLDKFGFLINPTDTLFPAYSLVRTDTALWAGTDRGVAWLRDGATRWAHTQLETPQRPVFSLAYHDGTLWAGSRARVFRSGGAGWTQATTIFTQIGSYALNNTICEIRSIAPAPQGGVYFTGGDPRVERRGVYFFHLDGTTVTQIPFDGPPMNGLVRLAFDLDESLWVSTKAFGVAKLTPSGEWVAYNSASGDVNLSSRYMNLTLLADSQGSKWFCTLSYPTAPVPLDELRDQLDADYANDQWSHYTTEDGLASLRNQSAAEDPEGNRWFLSDEDAEHAAGWWGMSILSRDKSGWLKVNPQTTDPTGQLLGMKAGNVTDVAFGAQGVVYVALKTYGVQRWETGGYDRESLFDLSDDRWTTLLRAGGPGGIATGANIFSLALRSDGVLWIGTDVGVYRYDRGALSYIPRNQGFGAGLLGNKAMDVLLDRKEDLWVATNLGLNRISRNDLNDIASFTTPVAYQQQLNLFFPFSVVSGIVDAECERLALHPTKDLLYIATAGGLSELDITFPDERTGDAAVTSRTYVYPNPIEPRKSGHSKLKIANIDGEALVEIFTVEGQLIHSAKALRSGDEVWDLTTKSGTFAASGVYVVRISGAGGAVTRTVSLVR